MQSDTERTGLPKTVVLTPWRLAICFFVTLMAAAAVRTAVWPVRACVSTLGHASTAEADECIGEVAAASGYLSNQRITLGTLSDLGVAGRWAENAIGGRIGKYNRHPNIVCCLRQTGDSCDTWIELFQPVDPHAQAIGLSADARTGRFFEHDPAPFWSGFAGRTDCTELQ
jgi:hypothetical protein